jgi:molybdopterin/thiamine biosynthesis adenylyltransferase
MTGNGEPSDRYSSQIGLFGAEGQMMIERASVAVIGLGGLGSHVCQQLAYLGVRRFTVVDHDIVEDTNLNRLIGAALPDVRSTKVSVAKRMIEVIVPGAEVSPIGRKIPHPDVEQALTGVDVVFGCVDNDYPRLVLNQLCAERHLPYIDSASGIDGGDERAPVYGGRVLVAGTSAGCLHCLGLLSQREIRLAQMTPEELDTEAAIYGVPVAELIGTGPSVVSINGVVASLAVTEFMALTTGLREPLKLLNYRGDTGAVRQNIDEPSDECYCCSQWARPSDQTGSPAAATS